MSLDGDSKLVLDVTLSGELDAVEVMHGLLVHKFKALGYISIILCVRPNVISTEYLE